LALGRKAGEGDTRDQLQRRAAFLATGAFDFIADAVLALTPAHHRPALVLDVGCGTGYYLDRVMRGLGREWSGLGLDLSKEAARLAAHRHATAGFAVVDIWSAWPVRSAAVDLLINLFAPKNFAEMARTVRPGGQLAMAYPGPRHLIELRLALGLIGMRSGKAGLYRRRLQDFGQDTTHYRLARTVPISHSDALDLILMGPNARHLPANRIAPWPATKPVTFEVELLTAIRRSRTG
jgi:23S rRNA (guanine745-N1)-methyltransferase